MTLSRPEPTLTGGDFQCRHCRLLAGSSPSLPDGSNPSAAIVQSASDVQCSRLLKTTPLISGAVSPYCSREFLQRHAPIDSPQALSQLPLLHDEERGTWAEWFQVAEVKHASALNGLLLEDGQLALTGLGCSLLREPLVAPMSPAANW